MTIKLENVKFLVGFFGGGGFVFFGNDRILESGSSA